MFSWKKNEPEKKEAQAEASDTPSGGSTGNSAAPGGFDFSPDKARRFFERAATVHEATNFEYAMSMWLSGLRQDPTSMAGLEGFFKSAASYMGNGGKGTPKDLAKEFSGKTELDKFLRALLEWGTHPLEAEYAIAAIEAATNLGLVGAAVWIAPRALGAAAHEKKPKKAHFIAVMEAMQKFEQYEMAVEAGEAAMRIDPSDAKLAVRIRNISAESTMSRGGFDDTGKEGGFRANIRDATRQRQLEEEQRIGKTEDVQERLIEQARQDYQLNQLDRPNAMRYIQRLVERGTLDDETKAIEVALEAYKNTQEHRFQEQVDHLRLKQTRRRLAKLKAAAEAPDAGNEAKKAFKTGLKEYIEAETKVYEAQVKAYPTDLLRKYELGKRYYQLGRFEDAIGQLQEAKSDVRHKAAILNMLGQAFTQIGWIDEAIETLRQAIEAHSDTKDTAGMGYRYDLMLVLTKRATDQKDLSSAEEAYKIASSIAIEQINFREIRSRREEIKDLLARLKQP